MAAATSASCEPTVRTRACAPMHSRGRGHVTSQPAHARACRFDSAICAGRLDPGSNLSDAVGLGQQTLTPMPNDHVVRMKRGGEEKSDLPPTEFVRQFVSVPPCAGAGGHIQNDGKVGSNFPHGQWLIQASWDDLCFRQTASAQLCQRLIVNARAAPSIRALGDRPVATMLISPRLR